MKDRIIIEPTAAMWSFLIAGMHAEKTWHDLYWWIHSSTSYVKEPLLDRPNKIGIEPCVTPSTSSNISTSSRIKPADIDKHVQKGIEFHELGELEKATHHFRQCAKEGSPIGMFLYGISLRHGWVSCWIFMQCLCNWHRNVALGMQSKQRSCFSISSESSRICSQRITKELWW